MANPRLPQFHTKAAATRRTSVVRNFLNAAIGLAVALLLQSNLGQAQAQDDAKPAPAAKKAAAAKPTAALIRLPLPVTGNVDNRVQSMVERVLEQLDTKQGRPILVIEFSPGHSEFGEGSDFTRALALARFLSSPDMSGVRTVAYLPRSIKGHAVLVAMACEEIVMDPDAVFGEAGLDEPAGQAIEPEVRSSYAQFAERRRTIPPVVALGMLDKDLEVLKVATEVNPAEYVLREDLPALRDKAVIQSESVLIPRGELGRFTGREGRSLGFVKYLAADRDAVARALDLPVEALEEDPALSGEIEPVQLAIEGEINSRLVHRAKSMIDDQLRLGEVNFLLLRIDSEGGSLSDSIDLANYLSGLDPWTVRTVAYIPKQAKSDAALIAMACHDVVMHPDAVLGGKGVFPIPPDEIEPAHTPIKESIAESQSRSWSLIAALIDPSLKVFRYRHNQTGAVDYFCAEELAEQDEPDQWTQLEKIKPGGEPLELSGGRAKDLGMARHVVESFAGLKQAYGMDDDPRLVEPNWADFLVDALGRPEMAWLLLVIGGVAIYAELNMPGIGIGGFIATVCFLLFFWSKFLGQTADWLEVMLFLGGLCCLLLEIFVLPGFGIFGLGGGLMILASLILASQSFVIPSGEKELREFQTSLLVVGGAGFGIIAAGGLLRRYLPHAPMFNRILLEPPGSHDLDDYEQREAVVDFAYLIGQQGVATTNLMPSGKARIGEVLIDVRSDGDAIDKGARVMVVEARGNHVVVQLADNPTNL